MLDVAYMKISDFFVANLVFGVGGAISLLPLAFIYLTPSIDSIIDPLSLMFIGLGGMSWLCSGFVMLSALERTFARQAKESHEYLDRCLKAFGHD